MEKINALQKFKRFVHCVFAGWGAPKAIDEGRRGSNDPSGHASEVVGQADSGQTPWLRNNLDDDAFTDCLADQCLPEFMRP